MKQDNNKNSKPATKLKDDPIFKDLTPAELAEVEAFDKRFEEELAKMNAIKEEIKQYKLNPNNLLSTLDNHHEPELSGENNTHNDE